MYASPCFGSIDAEMWVRLILPRALEDRLPCHFSNNPGQVVVENKVLIMPADNTLSGSEKAHDCSWMDGPLCRASTTLLWKFRKTT